MSKKLYILSFLAGLLFITSCKEDEPQPITVNFTNATVGISASNAETDVTVTFSRPAPSSGSIELSVNTGSLVYGETNDFYTSPAMSGNKLTISYNAGDESAKFTIYPGSGLNIQQDEEITVSFEQNNNLFIGTNTSVKITFSENYVAASGTMEMNGGGASFPNQAFIDLSKLIQTTVDKKSWDLGFYTASGEHRVIVNSSASVMARKLDKNDLTAVTASDTVGFKGVMTVPPPNYDPSIGSIAWVDSPDGKLATTAFGTISSTDADNKVFIVKDAGGNNWKKVRVLKNGDNYTLQHADIAATTFTSTTINKDAAFNFIFFDLDNGIKSIEPKKDKWDLMYGSYTESLNLGGPGKNIPYSYNDYITINRHGVSVAMVKIADIAYNSFSASNVAALTFKTEVNSLGATWRMGGGPNSAPALYTDRYFVIKDAENNIYKLKFTRLTSTTGERGYPEFSIQLVQ